MERQGNPGPVRLIFPSFVSFSYFFPFSLPSLFFSFPSVFLSAWLSCSVVNWPGAGVVRVTQTASLKWSPCMSHRAVNGPSERLAWRLVLRF